MKTKTSIYHRTFAFAYVLLVAVIFCGCGEGNIKKEDSGLYFNKMGSSFKIIELDSCEYFFYVRGNKMALAHKGNCKFCAERSKK